jgi:uncharacterized protein
MIHRLCRIFLCLLPALALMGCDGKPVSSLPVTQMRIGSETFSLEIATSLHDQSVGLMHRDHLDSDHGMLFIFGDEQERYFYNEDVHFPLDVVFLDSAGKIVSIKRLEAYNARTVPSDARAEYVIELNAGTASGLKLKVGDTLTLPKGLPAAVNP